MNDGDKVLAEGVDHEVRYEDDLYAGMVVKEFLILEDPDLGKEDPDDGNESENRPVQKKRSDTERYKSLQQGIWQ